MRFEFAKNQYVTIYRKTLRDLILICTVLLGIPPLSGQSESEVSLSDFVSGDGGFEVSVPVNISQNPGYDNQPHFLSEDDLLYARTRNGQTDIARYSLSTMKTTWLSDTPGGSEYSPIKIPGKNAVSAIRLDTDGLQRLYSYPLEGGQPQLLIPDLKIGYHLWFNHNKLFATILVEERMDLVVVEFESPTRYQVRTLQEDVGRSLLPIPGTDQISYLDAKGDTLWITSLNALSGATDPITSLPEGVQDIFWLSDGTVACAYGNKLLGYKPAVDSQWRILHTFPPELGKITRIALNPEGNKLALTTAPDPSVAVDHQIYAFNSKDLESYIKAFNDSVESYDFINPDTPLCTGIDILKKSTEIDFHTRGDARYEIIHRAVVGNKVVDHVNLVFTSINGSAYQNYVVIYEVENGLISRITYINRD